MASGPQGSPDSSASGRVVPALLVDPIEDGDAPFWYGHPTRSQVSAIAASRGAELASASQQSPPSYHSHASHHNRPNRPDYPSQSSAQASRVVPHKSSPLPTGGVPEDDADEPDIIVIRQCAAFLRFRPPFPAPWPVSQPPEPMGSAADELNPDPDVGGSGGGGGSVPFA